jgi:outer membrane protein OmpA-like peptidoglycan-associated protein
MKITHSFQKFSLAVFALIAGGLMLASPAPAQFDPGETAGVSVGSSAGGLLPITELEDQMGLRGTAYLRRGLLPITELEDQMGLRGTAYLRRGLLPNWQFELNGGYERLLATDSATDVTTISGRLLFSPITRSDWNLFLFGGVGLMRYDWEQPEISSLRTPGLDVIGSVPVIPLGTGIQYKLSDILALEVTIGYEMALSDAVNAVEEGGNDASLQGRVGLTLGSFGPPPRPLAPVAPVAEPVVAPPVEEPAPEPEPPMEEVAEEPEMEMPAPRVVLFALNSAKLSSEAMGILDDVVMDLGELPEIGVMLRGHTDSTGSVWYNSRLGMRRAVSVQKYLMSKGIDAGRMSLESKGEKEPVARNATKEGRRQNRRVEIIISE